MKLIISTLLVVLFIGFTSCNQNGKQNKDKSSAKTQVVNNHFAKQGIILKVLQTSSYTYVLVKVNSDTNWLAISKMPVETGQTLYYNNGLETKGFHSKELNRTFADLSLVQEASTHPSGNMATKSQMGQKPVIPKTSKNNITIKPVNGSISIAELYAHKATYSEKTVKVRGKVTKYNPNIMGKNWVHIQDGTGNNGNFDLTVTTHDQIKLGDVVTFEGKITLNKDFGAGYYYPVIMEGAKSVK